MITRFSSLRLPVVMAAASSAIAGAVLVMNDASRSVIATSGVGVWFANDQAGSVSHISPTGVDATVTLKGMSDGLIIELVDGVPFVADDSGRLVSIDPSQLVVTKGVAQLPSNDTELVSGGGRLYAVDKLAGTVTELSLSTLKAVAPVVTLGGTLLSAVADDDGSLWVASSTGEVSVVAQGRVKSTERVKSGGADLQLAIVDGTVLAVDAGTDSATVTVLSGDERGRTHTVPLAPGDVHAPERVIDALVLPVLSGDAVLAILDVGSGEVRRTDIGIDDHDLGEPAATANRVYVPDYTNGQLLVIDLTTGKVLDTVRVTGRQGEFEVVVEGGRVYINDPNSERAWTIDSAGNVTETKKYDPNAPGGGAAVTPPVVPDRPPLPPPATTPELPPRPDDTKPNETKNENNGNGGNNGRGTGNTRPPAPVVVPPPTTQPTGSTSPVTGPTVTIPGGGGTGPTTSAAPLSDGAVRNVQAVADDRQATVTWAPPTNWRPVTGFEVTVQPGGIVHNAGASATSWTATGLTNGTTYTFTLVAQSANGPGIGVPSNSVTPAATVPGAPRSVGVTPGDGNVAVSWQAPSGSPVDDYRVEILDGGGTVVSSRSTASTAATVNGLTNGTSYTAVVSASRGGVSTAAPPSSPFVPRGRPGLPSSPAASQTGGGTVAVTWGAPASNGGSPVTGYVVGAAGVTAQNLGPSADQATFTGLTVGTVYSFTVRAVNAAGTSDPATASDVTVQAQVPSAPGTVNASPAGPGTVYVTWGPASGNGTTIDRYEIRPSGGGAVTSGTVSGSATINGLVDGTTYTFDVVAIGANGAVGPPSTSNAVTPFGNPNAPTNVNFANITTTSADVTFAQQSPSNGTTVGSWRVTTVPDTGTRTVNGTSFSLTGLSPSTSYTVNIVAVGTNNSTSVAGSGQLTTATPIPDPVVGVSLTPTTVTWIASANAAYYIVSGDVSYQTTGTMVPWQAPMVPGDNYYVTVTPYNSNGQPGTAGDAFLSVPCTQQGNQIICP
jgi:hypothetical protein